MLIQLGRFANAAQVLDSVKESRRDAFWSLRRGEAHLAINEQPQALECVDNGLRQLKLPAFQSTFLSLRADVVFAMSDSAHQKCLQDAIDCCRDEQYRIELREKLALRASGTIAR